MFPFPNPLVVGSGGSGVTLGPMGSMDNSGSSGGMAADRMHGQVYTVPANGTLDTMHALGGPTGSSSGNYRLVIYAATGLGTWQLKLGETSATTGIPVNTQVDLPLISPVSVTAGQKIALCIHTGSGSPRIGIGSGLTARFFSDTFSDGAASDYTGLTGTSEGPPAIWVTGTQT